MNALCFHQLLIIMFVFNLTGIIKFSIKKIDCLYNILFMGCTWIFFLNLKYVLVAFIPLQ